MWAGHISLVITAGAGEEPGQCQWVAWTDWQKSLGQWVPLDEHHNPMWMPASMYPGKQKVLDYSMCKIIVWTAGRLIKLRRDRVPIALEMVHLKKLCARCLDWKQARFSFWDEIAVISYLYVSVFY